MNLTKKHVERWVVGTVLSRTAVGYRTEAEAARAAVDWCSHGRMFAVLAYNTGRRAIRYGWLTQNSIVRTFATRQNALRHATVSETAWQIVAIYEVTKAARKIGGVK